MVILVFDFNSNKTYNIHAKDETLTRYLENKSIIDYLKDYHNIESNTYICYYEETKIELWEN